jgi:hypothetical protein
MIMQMEEEHAHDDIQSYPNQEQQFQIIYQVAEGPKILEYKINPKLKK